MPITADKERELLNKYHLTSLYPSEWPHQDDDDEEDTDSDEDAVANGLPGRQKTNASTKSRKLSSTYKNIDRHASIRSSLSGTQKTASGEDSLVQKDEADPLGMAPSVATELKRRGLPVEDNVKLRNRFMLLYQLLPSDVLVASSPECKHGAATAGSGLFEQEHRAEECFAEGAGREQFREVRARKGYD